MCAIGTLESKCTITILLWWGFHFPRFLNKWKWVLKNIYFLLLSLEEHKPNYNVTKSLKKCVVEAPSNSWEFRFATAKGKCDGQNMCWVPWTKVASNSGDLGWWRSRTRFTLLFSDILSFFLGTYNGDERKQKNSIMEKEAKITWDTCQNQNHLYNPTVGKFLIGPLVGISMGEDSGPLFFNTKWKW